MKKKWLGVIRVLLLAVVTTTAVGVAQAKYEETITIEVKGRMAKWGVSVVPLKVTVDSKKLYPGCKYEIGVTLRNDSEVPVKVEVKKEGGPSFLKVDTKSFPKTLRINSSKKCKIVLSVDKNKTTKVAGKKIDFKLKVKFIQNI